MFTISLLFVSNAMPSIASGCKSFFFLLANFTEIIWVIDCGDWIGKLLKNNPLGTALGKLG